MPLSAPRLLSRTAAVLGLALLLPLAASAEDLVRSFPVLGPATLHIRLDAGRVELVVHDADTVRIEARARGLGASSVRFEARSEGRDVVVRSTAEPWVAWMRSGPSVRVRAWIPRGSNVVVHGDPAAVQVVGAVAQPDPAARLAAY